MQRQEKARDLVRMARDKLGSELFQAMGRGEQQLPPTGDGKSLALGYKVARKGGRVTPEISQRNGGGFGALPREIKKKSWVTSQTEECLGKVKRSNNN